MHSTIPEMIDSALLSIINSSHAVKKTACDIQDSGFDGEQMDKMRKYAEKCLKAVHEYQAYINSLDGMEDGQDRKP